MGRVWIGVVLALLVLLANGSSAANYYGTKIGSLKEFAHGVRGDVYAVDSRTIHLRNFHYDGAGPDAYFYAGSTPRPSPQGFIVPDEKGSKGILGAYANQHLTLTLPKGKTLRDIKWFSVWCDAFTVDFGHVEIPANLDYPRPQKIDALPTLEHDVSSDRVVVVDAQTFLIPSFSYDGTAPDAFFWVGKGSTPSPSGQQVPDENGSVEPLKRYSKKTIVITLPGDLTVFDIDYLSVWCRAFYADFGHVIIPKGLKVPPSLKMLGVAPQTKLNCEVLKDDLAFEVRWAVAGESIVMQLVGRVKDGEYMAFGLSGQPDRSVMVDGDVVVGWLNQTTRKGAAQDYHLGIKAQCQGGQGSCPDHKIQGSTNNVRLLNAALINGFTMLTFQRPLRAVDPATDKSIYTNRSQAVIWAVGPVNSQGDTSYHTYRLNGNMLLDFGRNPSWNCPLPEDPGAASPGEPVGPSHIGRPTPAPAPAPTSPWYIPPIPCYEPEDGVFYAQIGPTGGKNGYNAITGHVGWGIAWYVNGLLIPEIYVVRGKTYTFVVEGGNDPDRPARSHPFYITDDPEGGYDFKTPAEKSQIRVFAGMRRNRDGTENPTAFGRLCEWKEDSNQPADTFESFGAYQRTLNLECENGDPGILQWTPDRNTPDTVYYQCFTHRYLGWKIRVVDSCEGPPGSGVQPQGNQRDYDYPYDYYADYAAAGDVSADGSVNHERQAAPPGSRDNQLDARPQGKPNFPGSFDYKDFPHDFPFNFDSFPFGVGDPSDRSTPQIPLGSPGFEFPKLPDLKRPTGVVNASAFAELENFRDGGASSALANHRTTDLGSPFAELPKRKTTHPGDVTQRPKYRRPSSSSSATTNPTTPSRETSKLPLRTKTSSTKPYSRKTTILLESGTRRTSPLPKPSSIRSTFSHEPSTLITTPYSRATTRPPKSTSSRRTTSTPEEFQTHAVRTSFPTTFSTSGQNRKKGSSTPPRRPSFPLNVTPHRRREPDVVTAASLPTLPGQLPPFTDKSPFQRQPEVHRRPLPSPPHPVLQESTSIEKATGMFFAKNTGFKPESVVFESDFQPIKDKGNGPVLAFEVSSSDHRPILTPLAPHQLRKSQSQPQPPHLRPPGSRIRFSHRQIAYDSDRETQSTADADDDDDDDFDKSPVDGKLPPNTLGPIFQSSEPDLTVTTFSESIEPSPIPIPVPLVAVAPVPAAAPEPPSLPQRLRNSFMSLAGRRRPSYRLPPPRRPERVNRYGRPPQKHPKPENDPGQAPPMRRVTTQLNLDDNHLVPVPQLVGPEILTPIKVNLPLVNGGKEFLAAESSQIRTVRRPPFRRRQQPQQPVPPGTVFTSDGRPLDLGEDVPPVPTRFQNRKNTKSSAAALRRRPQLVPFRGERPPPVPVEVPHLPQFSRQSRPRTPMRRVTIPPFLRDSQSNFNPRPAGSSPDPVVVPQQEPVLQTQQDEVVPAALLYHDPLVVEEGNNFVLTQFNETSAPAERLRGVSPVLTHESAPSNTNGTHLTILKDVWAILTKEDPSLMPEAERTERHVRDAEPKSSSSLTTYPGLFAITSVVVFVAAAVGVSVALKTSFN